MSDAPKDRKTHIRRYIGTNAAGDKLTAIWADMLRIDEFSTIYNGGLGPQADWPSNQKILHTFFWDDDPTGNNAGVGNQNIETTILKLCSAYEIDPRNPVVWIEIPVTLNMMTRATRLSDTGAGDDQVKKVTFHTPDENATDDQGREYDIVKVTHKDTNIDDNDAFKFGGVIPFDQYAKDDATENVNDYVNACILSAYKTKASHESGTGVGDDQKKKVRLRNQYLTEQFNPPDTGVASAPPFNPPWMFDPMQLLWNVKFGTIYIVVTLAAANQSFSSGPYGPSPSVSAPTISATGIKDKGAVLLDTFVQPGSNNSTDGPIQCMSWFNRYTVGSVTAQQAYEDGPFHAFGLVPYINGACDISNLPEDDDAAPIDFQKSITRGKQWLFMVPPVDGSVIIDIGNLMQTTDTGPNHPSNNQVTTQGSGSISISVWSTARGKIKTIDQLVDIHFDGKPRPTEDDSITCGVNSTNQGRFLVNVNLDKNRADRQTDNWGNKYQPYKVTLTPNTGVVDHIPDQPPPRLPG